MNIYGCLFLISACQQINIVKYKTSDKNGLDCESPRSRFPRLYSSNLPSKYINHTHYSPLEPSDIIIGTAPGLFREGHIGQKVVNSLMLPLGFFLENILLFFLQYIHKNIMRYIYSSTYLHYIVFIKHLLYTLIFFMFRK